MCIDHPSTANTYKHIILPTQLMFQENKETMEDIKNTQN